MTTAAAPKQLAALLVAHAQLVPSLTNPRKRFDRDRLEELALSMAPPVGILEPLVVRSFDPIKMIGRDPAAAANMKHPGPFYEIIAGERRWRAAAIAKLDEIPIVVREIADDQVIKLQLVENKNREDIHPLDEAEAMERLLKLSKAETPKTIAATIGMSERYVQNRLHYLRLVPEVKEAFRTDVITAGHVDLLMRLPADEQTRAFKDGLYDEQFDYDEDAGKNHKRLELRSVRDLGNWIAGHVRLPLDAKSPQLELLPDVTQAVTESAAPGAATLVELCDSYGTWQGKSPAPLMRAAWAPVQKGQKCDSQVRGVIVIGRTRGRILTVCTGVGVCKKHFPHTIEQKPRPTESGVAKPKSKGNGATDHLKEAEKRDAEKRRKARDRDRLLNDVARQALDALEDTLPKTPTPATVALVLRESGDTSWREHAFASATNLLDFGQIAIDTKEKCKLFKAVGIDLEKMITEAELKSKGITAPVKSKKPARGVVRKNASAGTKKALAPKKPKRKAGAKK